MASLKRLFIGSIPVTRGKTKSGDLKLTAHINDRKPYKNRIADILAYSLTAALVFVGLPILLLLYADTLKPWHALWLIAPLPLFFALKYGGYSFFTVTKRIEFTPDTIRFERGLFRTQSIDRKKTYTFFLEAHPHRDREVRKLDSRKQAEGQWRRLFNGLPFIRKAYFEQCYILYLNYMGEPIKIATIIGDKYKLAVPGTLNKCDAVLEAETGSGNSEALTPEGDWNLSSGLLQGDD